MVFAAAVLKHGDAANAGFGQTSARWRVLYQVGSGEVSVAEIARKPGYSRQAVQRLADALVAEGLATYSSDEVDRRRQRIELSAEGAVLLRELEANFAVWSERLVSLITQEELRSVVDGLERITRILTADLADLKREEVNRD
jgi:DNA-binding MarR family transcriptional regulator